MPTPCKSNSLKSAERKALEYNEKAEETAEAEEAVARGAAAVEAKAKVTQAVEEQSTVAAKTKAKRAVTKVDSNIHLPLDHPIALERKNKRNQS